MSWRIQQLKNSLKASFGSREMWLYALRGMRDDLRRDKLIAIPAGIALGGALLLVLLAGGCAQRTQPFEPICVKQSSKEWIATHDKQLAIDIMVNNELIGEFCDAGS